MNEVHIRKEPTGWRAYITTNGRVIVVDELFNEESIALRQARDINSSLIGNR